MKNETLSSLGYGSPSVEPDPIKALINEICIVNANNTSFCARLISIQNDSELWFESKSGQKWMIHRTAILSIRPLNHAPGGSA